MAHTIIGMEGFEHMIVHGERGIEVVGLSIEDLVGENSIEVNYMELGHSFGI